MTKIHSQPVTPRPAGVPEDHVQERGQGEEDDSKCRPVDWAERAFGQGAKIHTSASARRGEKSAISTKMQPNRESSSQGQQGTDTRLLHTRRKAAAKPPRRSRRARAEAGS